MLFYYIRHGQPIYSPDTLTPLGERQAEAIARRLALFGVDKIYASTSNRAIRTAQPLCDILRKEPVLLDFCNESYTWEEFSIDKGKGFRTWVGSETLKLEKLAPLGHRWYEHPELLAQYPSFKQGSERVARESDAFLSSLGYEHIPGTGTYRVLESNNERVALFAHAGFGTAFLSHILDIPYPYMATGFGMCHTGLTVINFAETGGYARPSIQTYSCDGHLYREGLPSRADINIKF